MVWNTLHKWFIIKFNLYLTIRASLAIHHALFLIISVQWPEGPSRVSQRLEDCRPAAIARRKRPIGSLSSSWIKDLIKYMIVHEESKISHSVSFLIVNPNFNLVGQSFEGSVSFWWKLIFQHTEHEINLCCTGQQISLWKILIYTFLV